MGEAIELWFSVLVIQAFPSVGCFVMSVVAKMSGVIPRASIRNCVSCYLCLVGGLHMLVYDLILFTYHRGCYAIFI